MKNKHFVTLKILQGVLVVLYIVSSLWIAFMHLIGATLYLPINDTPVENVIPFDLFFIIVAVGVVLLIVLKVPKSNFSLLILQDLGIIVLSVPLYILVFSVLNIGLSDVESAVFPLIGVAVLAYVTVSLNDMAWMRKTGLKT